MSATLPEGFECLAPFVEYWARDTLEQRIHARSTAAMADIEAFYAAMLPLTERAVACIDEAPLHALPPSRATLAKLVLSLAQAAVAVEMHRAPCSPGTPYPNSLRVVQGPPPYA